MPRRRTLVPLLVPLLALGAGEVGAQAPKVPDTLEQRVLACAICHGKQGEGIQKNEYYPRLGGKPAGYLYNQLVNFRERRRDVPIMTYMVAFLSDPYLREMAEYYANLHPPYPAPATGGSKALLARGEALATKGDPAREIPACAACHGKALTGMEPAIPGLVGLHRDYVAGQMGSWKVGRRKSEAPDCMAQVASRLIILGIAAVIIAAAAVLLLRPDERGAPAPAGKRDDTQIGRGEYLALVGDCLACHTVRGGRPYAGGLPIPTPFGTLYTPNITPDPATGIGKWSADDFWRALHDGIGKDGSYLYPAFPYTNYTKVTRADSDAMYAFFMALPPVNRPNQAHEMRFPYNQRQLLLGWRTLYFKPGEFQPNPQQSAEWNRGAYLVEGLGHCNACHGSRNILGAVKDDDIGGGLIPVQNWYAPSLSSARETGVGDWEVRDIVDLLRTGVSPRGAVYGPMSAVVAHSLQNMTIGDLTAMSVYLKSQVQAGAPGGPGPVRTTEQQVTAMLKQGASLYEKHCADCHQPDGKGMPRIYPPLAGNRSILMPYPVNAIRIVLFGGFPPSTEGNPRPYGMPPFYQDLSDVEVAALVTYIRQSWGNSAPAVSHVDVDNGRKVPVD